MIRTAACWFAEHYTRFSRHQVSILLLVPIGAAILLFGWQAGEFEATMIAVTLALSFDASLMSRCVALRQAQDAGEAR